MNKAIEKLLAKNSSEHLRFRDQRLREVLQTIVLLGLKRAGFFNIGSFYGGTALRLLHELDRFSEDLDFCLTPGQAIGFDFKSYFPAIEETLASFGFQMTVELKEKMRSSPVQSAFVKGNTYVNYFAIGEKRTGMNPNQVTKVKIEIDTEDPDGALREMAAISEPEPFLIQTLQPDSLFAGKLHAMIARDMEGSIKGRDFYDFLHFIGRGTKVNLRYLRAKLIDSKHIDWQERFDLDVFKGILIDKIRRTNFKHAVEDVSPFIYSEQKRSDLKHWTGNFFETFARTLQEDKSQDGLRGAATKEIQGVVRCKVCGVVIRKGSKTSKAAMEAALCSKHRPQ